MDVAHSSSGDQAERLRGWREREAWRDEAPGRKEAGSTRVADGESRNDPGIGKAVKGNRSNQNSNGCVYRGYERSKPLHEALQERA